jgi:hypothetical protein
MISRPLGFQWIGQPIGFVCVNPIGALSSKTALPPQIPPSHDRFQQQRWADIQYLSTNPIAGLAKLAAASPRTPIGG